MLLQSVLCSSYFYTVLSQDWAAANAAAIFLGLHWRARGPMLPQARMHVVNACAASATFDLI